MAGGLKRWWRRLRGGPVAADPPDSPPELAIPGDDHVPGRARLVFRDGSVVEAELGPEAGARLEYLARRAVAPPPPPAGNRSQHPL